MDNTEKTPLYRVENGVAWITMKRPETLNSFTPELIYEMNEAFDKAQADDNVKCIVLTGEGRAFTLAEQQELVKLCAKGIKELNEIQKEVLGGKVR